MNEAGWNELFIHLKQDATCILRGQQHFSLLTKKLKGEERELLSILKCADTKALLGWIDAHQALMKQEEGSSTVSYS